MYGIINQAIKDLVIKQTNEDVWIKICEEVHSPVDFISMEYYQDKLTYDLVGAVSRATGLDPHAILQSFGKHWTLYTAKVGYESIMDLFGSDFLSCLKNLNNLHERMGLSMPDLKPPHFSYEDITEKSIYLNYKSTRKGLVPMVKGLIEGLAEKYHTKVEINICSAADDEIARFKITVLE